MFGFVVFCCIMILGTGKLRMVISMAQEPKQSIRTGNSNQNSQKNNTKNSSGQRSVVQDGKVITTSSVLSPRRPGGNNNK